MLDDAEVSSLGYACNGSGAGNDARILMALTSEPAGANCASGGIRVASGPDSNGNDTLDGAEAISTQYVCNGASGAVGAPGQSALIATTAEPAGVNCTYGGTRISAGLDANGNGTLDSAEVSATSYTCNGAPGPGVTWTDVTANAIQAAENNGYLANNDLQQVVVTLPDNPAIGSVVQVSGLGRGGWKVAQSASQYVITSSLPGGYIQSHGYNREANSDWLTVTCSRDCGVILAADAAGRLVKSADGGETWSTEDTSRSWSSVASSATGYYLYAAVNGGGIRRGYADRTLSNWDACGAPALAWRGVAASADGTRVVAVAANDSIYISTNGCATFAPRGEVLNWSSIASSADGTRLVAAVDGGQIYTSTDSGVNWTAHDVARRWRTVASSADGQKLAAVVYGTLNHDGQLLTSADGGVTWTLRSSDQDWFGVASSADGTRLNAVNLPGTINVSVDSGETWTPGTIGGAFSAVASSADGLKAVAVGSPGALAVADTDPASQTTLGTSGYIVGGQHDAIALQYAGAGKFIVLSYSGTFVVR